MSNLTVSASKVRSYMGTIRETSRYATMIEIGANSFADY